MATAKEGDLIRLNYTGKFEDGSIFMTTLMDEPIQFTLGEQRIIPGFEKAIIGMKVGEWKSVKIPQEEAYGPYIENHTMVEERSQMPKDFEPAVGEKFRIREKDGRTRHATILSFTDTQITFDMNHPLAGQDLTFDINLVEILEK
jgi:FKBP-type peptidyl-prolyl cis-trans isomerase 2